VVVYLVRRLLQSVILIFIVSVVTFLLIHSAPGGPALLSAPEINAQEAEQMRKNLGLDDPLPVQYLRWLGNVFHGDLGNSYNTVKPVTSLVADRLPNTLLLAGVALGISILAALPLGILSAVRRNSLLDRAITGVSFLGVSLPVFWLGIILIVVFSVQLHLLPAGGMYTLGTGFSLADRVKHLLLPVITLVALNLAELMRYTRSAMINVLGEDYIRTARAKGLSNQVVVIRHAMRNGLIPVITVLGVYLPRAVRGAAITETVFSWPGMGRLAVDAANNRDYPVVLGATLTVAVVVVISSLLTDLAYGYLDPRVRVR
jgi:peptide/nickel transport system permease protein